MANTKISRTPNELLEYAVIDTAPDAAGFFTNELDIRKEEVKRVFFSIRETVAGATSVMTVVLQFKCAGSDVWQDYNFKDGTAWKAGDRVVIEDDGAGVLWRAGVKYEGRTSGSLTLGFDW